MALTCISIILRFFIHCGAKQTAKYVDPELNAIQLIPRSFIHCRAKRKVFWTLGPKVTGI